MNSIDAIFWSFIIGLGISTLYFLMTEFLPTVMNKVAIFLGPLVVLAISILLFVYPTSAKYKLAVAIILLVLFIIAIINIFQYRKELHIQGVFLKQATKVVQWKHFFYIPLFLLMLAAFAFILIMEFRSYWASGSLHFHKE